MPKKSVKDYSEFLAIKYGISHKHAHKILMHGFMNMCRYIESGKDIRIPHFGHVYFNKNKFSNYVKKIKDETRIRRTLKNTQGNN